MTSEEVLTKISSNNYFCVLAVLLTLSLPLPVCVQCRRRVIRLCTSPILQYQDHQLRDLSDLQPPAAGHPTSPSTSCRSPHLPLHQLQVTPPPPPPAAGHPPPPPPAAGHPTSPSTSCRSLHLPLHQLRQTSSNVFS